MRSHRQTSGAQERSSSSTNSIHLAIIIAAAGIMLAVCVYFTAQAWIVIPFWLIGAAAFIGDQRVAKKIPTVKE